MKRQLSIEDVIVVPDGTKRYFISLDGCDASTRFFIALTPQEAEGVRKVLEMAEETSTYGCEPTGTMQEDDGCLSLENDPW